MTTSENHANRSRLLQALGLLGLSVAVVAGLGWAAGRQMLTPSVLTGSTPIKSAPATRRLASADQAPPLQSGGALAHPAGIAALVSDMPAAAVGERPEVMPHTDQGYPPPATPSATPEPDEGGHFPPPSVEHRIITRSESPFRDLIMTVEAALAASAGDVFVPWVDQLGTGLALDFPGATEGLGIRLAPRDAADLMDQVFAARAEPVVQGYFEEAGCDHNLGETPPCAAVLVLTGLGGPLPMPTRHPSEGLGPPPPSELPLAAAAWSIYPDSTGPFWTDWWLGDGYHQLLETLAAEGHGTYYVLR